MPLCTPCQSLDLANLVDEENDLQDIVVQKSIVVLEKNASICDLCRLIWTSFVNNLGQFGRDIQTEMGSIAQSVSPVLMRGRRDCGISPDWEPGDIYHLKVRCDRLRVSCDFSLYAEEEEGVELIQQLKGIMLGRQIKPPAQQMGLLREWARNCNKNHAQCRRDIGPLPTRVIDVGKEGQVEPRLVETDGKADLYMTLSHCWGRHPVIQTTSHTINDHLQALPLIRLPKTFRDAVIITRAMGVQYLWIDSLCIIQDSKEDWERESAQMGMIYFSSYLTIAASASCDSRGGCFVPREATSSHAEIEHWQIRTGHQSKIYIRPRPADFSNLDERTLHTRAWVLQEQVLSARMINFDVDQLLWKCQEARLAEDGITSESTSLHDGPDMSQSLARYEGGHRSFEWELDWYSMIGPYTHRGITKSSDKLPALSGLAKVMEQRTGVEYVAGLWKSNLCFGLLWHRKRRWLVPPADGYRAPSWSWASLEGGISITGQSGIMGGDMEVAVEDVQTELLPSGLDPKGNLKSGHLELTGRVRTFDRRMDPNDKGYQPVVELNSTYEKNAGIDYFFDNGELVGQVVFDEAFKSGNYPLYCLQMTYRTGSPTACSRWYGLFLEPTGKENEFRRIGYGWTEYVHNKMWFENVQMQRIRIV